MKMVYTNENRFMTNNVKNLIEAQGIETFIKNEFSQGAVGGISTFDSWPEIWIFDDSHFDRAIEIAETSQSGGIGVDWTCQHCSEKNDVSFEICWSCQSANLETS